MVDQAVGGAVSASTPGPPKPVDAQQLKVVKIAPDGDLILVVGTDEILILASSHCFRTASKSFVAILKPNFREGVDFSTRLKLPDDHSQASSLLAQLLHLQCPPIDDKQKQSKGCLLKLLVLAHKYNCLRVVYHYATLWATSFLKRDPSAIGIDYLLDDAKLFQNISTNVILKRPPLDVSGRAEIDPEEVLPPEFWRKCTNSHTRSKIDFKLVQLEKQHRKLWASINTRISEFRAPVWIIGTSGHCTIIRRITRLEEGFSAYSSYGLLQLPIIHKLL